MEREEMNQVKEEWKLEELEEDYCYDFQQDVREQSLKPSPYAGKLKCELVKNTFNQYWSLNRKSSKVLVIYFQVLVKYRFVTQK